VPAVVVVGSGAAGLAAALRARTLGADVVVLEAAATIGGTTALSGGVVWAPGHHLGPPEAPAGAASYLATIASGDFDAELARAFVTDVPVVVREIEELTPLRWAALPDWPDYHAEASGARAGGRCIWPEPLTLPPSVADRVLAGPDHRPARPLDGSSIDDPSTDGPSTGGPSTDGPSTGGPSTDGVVFRGPVRGRALVGGLLAACLDAGVEVRGGSRVTAIGPAGAQVGDDLVAGRVVLASGGFQHAADLVRAFLPAAPIVALGPPECAGDGLRMALTLGSALGNMAEGWWMPAISIPGEELGGAPFYRPLHHERAQAGSVMVDRLGRRFVDEAQSYGEVGRAMLRAGTGEHPWPAAPAWMVFDSAYRSTTEVGPLAPGTPDPEWLLAAADLEELAGAMPVPADSLLATVSRFNDHAAAGRDPDFGRGDRHYDRWISGGHPLAPVAEPPFYALSVWPGCMGTKGGPRTDTHGRVMAAGGGAVPGLYAAGNAAASPFGTATAAGGATLGPALVFGWRAGRAAVVD
jgi:3-oxosteroid 1-dehydrogenase